MLEHDLELVTPFEIRQPQRQNVALVRQIERLLKRAELDLQQRPIQFDDPGVEHAHDLRRHGRYPTVFATAQHHHFVADANAQIHRQHCADNRLPARRKIAT